MEELFIKSVLIIALILITCLAANRLGHRKTRSDILVLMVTALAITVCAGRDQVGVLPSIFIAFLVVKTGAWLEKNLRRTSGT